MWTADGNEKTAIICYNASGIYVILYMIPDNSTNKQTNNGTVIIGDYES